jgi:hypothetical protein
MIDVCADLIGVYHEVGLCYLPARGESYIYVLRDRGSLHFKFLCSHTPIMLQP